MPANEARRICSKIEQYAANRESLSNNVKALAGSGYIWLRIGGWRVIMDDQGVILDIIKIAPRGNVYS